jgi:predicted nucleotidyltransferase
MPSIIDQHRTELQVLCRRFQVKTLELFGSASAGTFDPLRSDLDFLVDFLPMPPSSHSQAYFVGHPSVV